MTEPHIHGQVGGSNHQPLPGFHRPKQKGGQLKKSRDDLLYSQKSPFFFLEPPYSFLTPGLIFFDYGQGPWFLQRPRRGRFI